MFSKVGFTEIYKAPIEWSAQSDVSTFLRWKIGWDKKILNDMLPFAADGILISSERGFNWRSGEKASNQDFWMSLNDPSRQTNFLLSLFKTNASDEAQQLRERPREQEVKWFKSCHQQGFLFSLSFSISLRFVLNTSSYEEVQHCRFFNIRCLFVQLGANQAEWARHFFNKWSSCKLTAKCL